MKSGVRIIEAVMKRWEQRQYQKVADMLMLARDEWWWDTVARQQAFIDKHLDKKDDRK